MSDNNKSNPVSQDNQQTTLVLYRLAEKKVVLLNELLILLKKEREWIDNTFANGLLELPPRYCFRLEVEQRWMLDEPNTDEDIFAITEAGAYFIIAHLENDEKGDLFGIIKEIFSKEPELPRSRIADNLFSNLTPLQKEINGDHQEENTNYYHSILENALTNHSIRNIAIAAPYGAGKSTIIDSFFKNKKAIYVSLGTFDDEQIRKITQEHERQKVEKNILQQLIYQSDPQELPNSRILRIYHIDDPTKRNKIAHIIGFFFSIVLIQIDKLFPILETNSSYLTITIFLKILGVLGIIFIAAPVVFELFKNVKNIKISKFSTLAGDVELSHGTQLSVFNQYMDELLYFFERAAFKYVIIEDLDRFGDVEIFARLRSLNQTLNNYPRLKERNIVFIYAMRDDIFAKDHRDRTKFFDLIIPIIPIINSSNSKDKFKALLTSEIIHTCKLDESFIDEVSEHIQDMRLLKNIVNEFFVHWRLLRSKYQYDGNELLAAILYKNLVPADFAAYHENKGFLKQLKAFKKCLYDYAVEKDPNILKDENDKTLEIGEIRLHTLINSLDEPLHSVRPSANKHFYTFRKKLGLDNNEATDKQQDNKQKDLPFYNTYLASPIFLTLLRSGYLNENVEQFISFVHLDLLSYEEQQYVRTINQRTQPENLATPITRRVVEKIYLSVFDHKVALIPALVEYIFSDDDFDTQQKRILNLLVRQKNEAFNFLNELVESESLRDIITQLVSRWENFWIHVPAEFLSKSQVRAILLSLPKVENQPEVITNAEDEKLKGLIDGDKINFNKENLDLIAKSKPNVLAYFLIYNQKQIKNIQTDNDWLGTIRRSHPNVSDENLKKLEISLWPTSKGYHDIRDKVRPSRIKHHCFFTHDVSDKNFLEVDSKILEAEKGFISIWVYASSPVKNQHQWIISHSLNNGEESDKYESRYFYPSGWGINIYPPSPYSGNSVTCKLTSYKKEIPEGVDEKSYIGSGVEAIKPIVNKWHLFTIAWYKKKNYIKFFIDTDEINTNPEQFSFENNWPDELSGRINFGCWENQKNTRHHLKGKIGPYIMVTEELTKDMLESYYLSKPI